MENVEKRANSKRHMLHRLKRHGLPPQDLLTIFKSNIRSLTEYAAPIWSGEGHSVERIPLPHNA